MSDKLEQTRTPLGLHPQPQRVHQGNTLFKNYDNYLLQNSDRMWDKQNQGPNPNWSALFQSLSTTGVEELEKRAQQARRYLRENGVAYSGFISQGNNRSWDLDIIPMLIDSNQWQEIENGLKQRAELFNFIYQDIYGERQLIKQGIIPGNLLYSHPGFLRPCLFEQTGEHPLSLFSSDIAWDEQGQLRVLKDSFDVPSGIGFALENRIVMTRVMAEHFRHIHVQRLTPFFRLWRNHLQNTRPHQQSPHIVVLTPGPDEEGYFEHAYLATRLGYSLVQGNDLIVKESKVWLKSIEGLKAVDIILRWLPSRFCDPLELDEQSSNGIPGLLCALREGNVAIINPMGVNFLESPGLLPFLPKIADFYSKSLLQLPSIQTWWCGQSEDFNYVTEHLSELTIRSTYDQSLIVNGASLSAEEQKRWQEKIAQNPYFYVAQASSQWHTLPTLERTEMKPYYSMIRTFTLKDEEQVRVMPGGLTKVANEASKLLEPIEISGTVKDTWVITQDNAAKARVWPLLRNGESGNAEETNEVLSSRAAEGLFWVGRYIERADSTARLLRTIISRFFDFNEPEDETEKSCQTLLLEGLTIMTHTFPGFSEGDCQALLNNPVPELIAICTDQKRIGSLVQVLGKFIQTSFVVRDFWTNDMWRIIDDVDELLHEINISPHNINSMELTLDQILTSIMSFIGSMTESLPNEKGWYFLDLGRRIERGSNQATLLNHCLTPVQSEMVEHFLLEALLINYESLATHSRRFRDYQRVPSVLELLILDKISPRSLAYQISAIESIVNELPRTARNKALSAEQKLVLTMSTRITLSDAINLAQVDRSVGKRTHLESLLNETKKHLASVSELINHHYFAHTVSGRQLSELNIKVKS